MKTTILASKKISKAFQVLCDNATILKSNWINPVLITDNDNSITISVFSVKIDSANSIYAGVAIEILNIYFYPDSILITFTTNKDFDDWYNYEGNQSRYFEE